ncbi:MAG: hypothetical protein AAB019_12020 [Planctomycetota bacterium]
MKIAVSKGGDGEGDGSNIVKCRSVLVERTNPDSLYRDKRLARRKIRQMLDFSLCLE